MARGVILARETPSAPGCSNRTNLQFEGRLGCIALQRRKVPRGSPEGGQLAHPELRGVIFWIASPETVRKNRRKPLPTTNSTEPLDARPGRLRWGHSCRGRGNAACDLLQCARWSGVANSRGTPSPPSPKQAFGLVSEFPNRRSGRSRLRCDQRKIRELERHVATSPPGRQRLCRCSVFRSACTKLRRPVFRA